MYQALSGEIQTGPNVFWVLSALNYAKSARNFAWLRSYMPKLRLASEFLFGLIQETPSVAAGNDDRGGGDDGAVLQLAKVPGSLMIDVFLRSNFTTDTNAMLVGFFREFADAEAFLGNTTGSERLHSIANGIAAAMNTHLWCRGAADGQSLCGASFNATGGRPRQETDGEGDHFVTQWNGVSTNDAGGVRVASRGSSGVVSGEDMVEEYRDFVDFDANLIACAHGVPTDHPNGLSSDGGARTRRILARIDGKAAVGVGGQCRASATFVSERYYGENDVTDGNTGDSWCAMGRIAWFDALARRAAGDVDGFEALILDPLRKQLTSSTYVSRMRRSKTRPTRFFLRSSLSSSSLMSNTSAF